MQTTAILFENLIQGLQTLLWILLFSFSFFDYNKFSFLLSDHWIFITAGIAIALIYLLGIIVDTAYYNLIIQRFESRWIKKHIKTKGETLSSMYFECILKNQELARFFQEKQSHLRMIRITVVNTPLVIVGFLCFNSFNIHNTNLWTYIYILFAGSIFEITIVYTWKKLYKYYATIIETAFLEAKQKNASIKN